VNTTVHALLRTAGQVVSLDSELPAVGRELLAAAGGQPAPAVTVRPDVQLWVERGDPVPDAPLVPVARGVWSDDAGNAVIDSAGGSGYRQWWSPQGQLHVRSGWRPRPAERAAAAVLPARRRALQAEVLLHYPAMWWSVLAGLAPVHASVVEVSGVPVLLAGPGGVGKTSLVAAELQRGAAAACDNLAMTDGVTAFGISEPLRLDADAQPPVPGQGVGGRATHGRREHAWTGRRPSMRPELLVVVRRPGGTVPRVRGTSPDDAARALVAGTYAAGELQRFWVLVAQLAMATGRGPSQPPVEDMAAELARRLPCLELLLADRPGPGLAEMLAGPLAEIAGGTGVREMTTEEVAP
jgi:hypothetical protein